jgi:hypothetical protein
VFLRSTALALFVAAWVGWPGCVASLAEEVPAKEKSASPQGADKPKPSANKPSANKPSVNKPSASRESGTKDPHPHESAPKDIDTRLPGLPTRRIAPTVSHTPGQILPRSLGSPLPTMRMTPPALPPPPAGAARLPHTVPQPGDAARNAFGAVTHHGAGVGATMPHKPTAVVAPAPNRGVINGTAMAPRGSGPATIGGPAKRAGVINGTTIRPKP